MSLTARLKVGFAVIIILSFLLGYTGFLGIERVKTAFFTVRHLTKVLYYVFVITYHEDLYLLNGEPRYKTEVDKLTSTLINYLERVKSERSIAGRVERYLAFLSEDEAKGTGIVYDLVYKLVLRVTDLNEKLDEVKRGNLGRTFSSYTERITKRLINAGLSSEVLRLEYLKDEVLQTLDPKLVNKIEDILFEIEDRVKDQTLLKEIALYKATLREFRTALADIVYTLNSYRELSKSLYEDIWREMEKQTGYTERAIIITMLVTTVLFILVLGSAVMVAYRMVKVFSTYFSETVKILEEIKQGNFKRRIRYRKSDGEFGILAQDFNEIMDILNENVGFIIEKSKIALSTKIMRIGDTCIDTNNPLVMARRVVEALVDLNKYKSIIEDDYSKEEIYKHLYRVLRDKFGVTRVIMLELNESKNRFEPVFAKDVADVPVDVVVNPNICRAKRTAGIVDPLDFPDVCPYAVDEGGMFSVCIPIMMGGEVKGIVKIIESVEKRSQLVDNMPFIVKYIEMTAPVVYAAKLLEVTREQSLKDGLTGLYNRRFLDSYLEKYISFADRKGFIVGFIMIDIDNFKRINDTYGHKNGDIVLKEVARIISGCVRSSDVVVRYGGEEFLVVLPDVAEGKSELVAEKIRRTVEMTAIQIEGKVLHITVSAGVAEYPKHGTDPYQVIKFADVALYKAKKTGKNRVVVFDEKEMEGILEGVDIPGTDKESDASSDSSVDV